MNKAEHELYSKLSPELGWHKARLMCFIKMLMGIFRVKTINLTGIATAMDSDAKIDSRYRRVRRFFSEFKIDRSVIARLIFKWFFSSVSQHYLIIDRTNWKLGEQDINTLMLSVSYGFISIPLFWINLGRAGNSNTTQRIELLEQYVAEFGTAHIAGLLGDREFIGKEWFQYLIEREIHFYIRIKSDTKLPNSRGVLVEAKHLFHSVQMGEIKLLRNLNLWGMKLSLSVTREEDNVLKIVATNRNVENALAIYAIRQNIETLFGCLKTRGCRFEDTHITDPEKVDRLLVLLAVSFCWAYKMGEWQIKNVAPIKIKSHGRKAESIFRYGFDFLRDTIYKLHRRYRDFKKCVRQVLPETKLKKSELGCAVF